MRGTLFRIMPNGERVRVGNVSGLFFGLGRDIHGPPAPPPRPSMRVEMTITSPRPDDPYCDPAFAVTIDLWSAEQYASWRALRVRYWHEWQIMEIGRCDDPDCAHSAIAPLCSVPGDGCAYIRNGGTEQCQVICGLTVIRPARILNDGPIT